MGRPVQMSCEELESNPWKPTTKSRQFQSSDRKAWWGLRALAAEHPADDSGGGPAGIKKLVAKILANEYVDFAELPPAKGKSRPLPHGLKG